MVNESGSQFLSTIIVLGFAQDTREPTVYNGREKSLSTIFVLGLWGGPPWATQKLQQNCSQWEHPETVAETVPIGNTQRLWQGWPHMGPLKRLWQGWSTVAHPEAVARVFHGGTPRAVAETVPWGTPRGCGRGNQFEKRTAFIKYIYSSRSSSRRIYKTTTTSTTDSFSETEIQCF